MITLKNVLRMNATSCIGFGTVFLSYPSAVAKFLGGDEQAPSIFFLVLGIGLILNGAHLLWTSIQSRPPKQVILYFSFGDFLWVFSSAALILLGIWITTPEGITSTLVVSSIVGTLGVLQIATRRELQQS